MCDDRNKMESNKQWKEGSRISALIVDDDAMIRKIHKAMLERLFNMDAKTVNDGKEAVELYRCGANFDIIFMDKEMPIMDGHEATKELRGMGVKSLIVGITTRADGKDTEEFLGAGSNYCFEKPLDRTKVEQVLQDHPHFTT
ncbi:hypothetical protein ACSQ67_012270 [Phaseolus vulgaris]